jgi:hypothetical protein
VRGPGSPIVLGVCRASLHDGFLSQGPWGLDVATAENRAWLTFLRGLAGHHWILPGNLCYRPCGHSRADRRARQALLDDGSGQPGLIGHL